MPSGQAHAVQMNVGVLSARELAAERRLIEASQRDRNRFGQLYERYFHRVYAFAITRTGDRTAAEDVTAETFHRALQNLSHFQWRGGPFSPWLLRLAANAAPPLPPPAPEPVALPVAGSSLLRMAAAHRRYRRLRSPPARGPPDASRRPAGGRIGALGDPPHRSRTADAADRAGQPAAEGPAAGHLHALR